MFVTSGGDGVGRNPEVGDSRRSSAGPSAGSIDPQSHREVPGPHALEPALEMGHVFAARCPVPDLAIELSNLTFEPVFQIDHLAARWPGSTTEPPPEAFQHDATIRPVGAVESAHRS